MDKNKEVIFFVTIKKKWVWGLGRVSGGQDGSEQRIEVFVKIKKKTIRGGGGRVWGVRVDVNE